MEPWVASFICIMGNLKRVLEEYVWKVWCIHIAKHLKGTVLAKFNSAGNTWYWKFLKRAQAWKITCYYEMYPYTYKLWKWERKSEQPVRKVLYSSSLVMKEWTKITIKRKKVSSALITFSLGLNQWIIFQVKLYSKQLKMQV